MRAGQHAENLEKALGLVRNRRAPNQPLSTMTTVDPTHIPAAFRAGRRQLSKEQAAHHARHSSSGRSPLQMSHIKDFRFEPYFLETVAEYVRVVEQDPYHRDEKYAEGSDIGVEGSRQIVVMNWSKVLWITIRDQVLNPLLQGAVWYVLWRLSWTYVRLTMITTVSTCSRGAVSWSLIP